MIAVAAIAIVSVVWVVAGYTLAFGTAASLRTVLGPPPLPWGAALELERPSQMWSMRRKELSS